jgi:type II secretory ATPase GspE/PulE/Tfp pilus assembly ATPase PilB-like protein
MVIATGNPAGPSESWRHEPLGQILKRQELVTEGQIEQALELQKKKGGLIGEILVELGFVAREEVLLALAFQRGMEIIDLQEVDNPEIQNMLNALSYRAELPGGGVKGQSLPPADLANSAPVVKLVNLVLGTAVKAGATEVRFEVEGEQFSVRYRVEGILYEMESPPFHLHGPVIGRLMRECGMDVSQRSRSQTGRVTRNFAGRKYLVEASYQPGSPGESMIWRLSPEPSAQG